MKGLIRKILIETISKEDMEEFADGRGKGAEKITVNRVAKMAAELSPRDVKIQYLDSRIGEFDGKNVSINKAKKLLNWEPEITFDRGMRMHHEWEASKTCYEL